MCEWRANGEILLGYVNRDPERGFRGSRESKGGQYARSEKEKEEWGDKRGE